MNPSKKRQLKRPVALKTDYKPKEITRPASKPAQPIQDKVRDSISLRKAQDRQDLQQKFQSSDRGNQLQQQRDKIQAKLKQIHLKKQEEMKQSKSQREPLLSRVNKLKAQVQDLDSKQQAMTHALQSKFKINQSTHLVRLQIYSESLEPLQARANEISAERQTFFDKKTNFLSSIESFENALCMCREEIDSRYTSKAEYIAQREECEEKLVQMKEFHPQEFEFSVQEEQARQEIIGVRRVKEQKNQEIQELQQRIEKLKRKIQTIDGNLISTRTAAVGILLQAPNKKSLQEIDRLEVFLNQKATQCNVPTIEELVLEVNQKTGVDIDEQILFRQLNLVADIERRLQHQWGIREKELHDQLKIATQDDDWDQMGDVEDTLFQEQRLIRYKMAGICQWKKEVEEVLGGPISRLNSAVADQRVIEQFRNRMISFLDSPQKKSFEHMLNLYIQKLNSRESVLHEPNSGFSRNRISLDSLQSSLEALQQEKSSYERKKVSMRKDLMRFIIQQKNLSRKLRQNSPQSSELREQGLKLQEQTQVWDRLVSYETDIIKNLLELLAEIQLQLKNTQKELKTLEFSFGSLDSEQNALTLQIQKILEAQRKEMMNSLQQMNNRGQSNEQASMRVLRSQIQDAQIQLNNAKAQLNEFDTRILQVLSALEQQESVLRTQQQVLDQAYSSNQGQIDSMAFRMSFIGDQGYLPANIRQDQLSAFQGNDRLEFVQKKFGNQGLSNQKTSQKKYYRLNLQDATPSQKMFYQKIIPLIEGAQVYKRLQKGFKLPIFDPLDRKPPETCGFGIRYFRLHKSLSRIDVTQPLKPGIQSTIPIQGIKCPVLPNITKVILKVQKKTDFDLTDIEDMKEMHDQAFRKRCKDCSLFPFGISLEQAGTIELIAKSDHTLNQWIKGITALVKYKKHLSKLKRRIESYTSV